MPASSVLGGYIVSVSFVCSCGLNWVSLFAGVRNTTAGVCGQHQAVQALALRQPLSPVVLSSMPLQNYMDDSGNRIPSSVQVSKAASIGKSSMAAGTSPTSPPMQDLENTTPMLQVEYSFEERRANLLP
jgi:hypothetical protein